VAINEQEFLGWLADSVTREVRRALHLHRERLKEDWAAGAYTRETIEASMLKQAEMLGGVQALELLIQLSYDDYVGMVEDGRSEAGGQGKHERAQAPGARGDREDL
jgi:hypothetical protein